jgi:protein TonB
VNEHAPRAAANPNAHYVAQRTQLGSGNTRDAQPTLIPRSSPAPVERAGVVGADGLESQRAGTDRGEEELLASRAPAVRVLYFAPPAAALEATEVPQLLEKRPELDMAPNDEGIELRMRGESKNQLWVAADTRESDVAVYLDSWRHKIERVGTMNFPDVARRRKLSGTPVIEVTIGADGELLQSVIRRSSGHPELDEAAMRILKLAAPYDRFPAALLQKHDQIRIAYEWQFLGGAAPGSSVFYAEPGAQP